MVVSQVLMKKRWRVERRLDGLKGVKVLGSGVMTTVVLTAMRLMLISTRWYSYMVRCFMSEGGWWKEVEVL